MFGSDDEVEDQAAVDLRESRLAEYAVKKAGKEKPAAKSIVTMEVKPWDDETDMDKLKECVRSIEMDGLVWGGGKLVPVGYGVSKLQINLVIEVRRSQTLPRCGHTNIMYRMTRSASTICKTPSLNSMTTSSRLMQVPTQV